MKSTKFITCAFALSLGLSAANAQQLPNASFDEDWVKCYPWVAGKTESTAQGTQPKGWTASNVLGYKSNLLGWAGKTTIINEVTPGNHSSKAAKLFNAYQLGQVIPGYMSLGTSWNTSVGTSGSPDGGVFGGINFTSQPDALLFDYIHTQGSGSTQPATVIAYMWKGTSTQTNVPSNVVLQGNTTKVTMTNRERNILGIDCNQGDKPTFSNDFDLIATLEFSITEANEDWATVTIPFVYKSDNTPAMINVIFSAMDYFADRKAHKANDALTVDNVRLVYYSRLSAVTVNGEAIEGFESTKYDYTLDTPFAADLAVEATALGKSAKVEKSVDEEAYTVTFKVTNIDADNDGETSHTYVVKFAEPKPADTSVPVEVESAEYRGIIAIYLSEEPAELEDQKVEIKSTGLGTCDFALDHFSLDGQSDMGNIRVSDVKTTKEEGSDLINYVGSATGIVLKLTEDENIYADVDIEGTEDSEHNLKMNIHVKWLLNGADDHETFAPIEVTFNGSKYLGSQTGIGSIVADKEEAARYFLINGVEVKDASAAGLYIVRRGNKVEKLIVK